VIVIGKCLYGGYWTARSSRARPRVRSRVRRCHPSLEMKAIANVCNDIETFPPGHLYDSKTGMDARAKMVSYFGIEKGILREAFDGLLPDSILWRQKKQFSDGVGYGWIDSLNARAEQQFSDREFRVASSHFPINTPATIGAYVYRKMFGKMFERRCPGYPCAIIVPGGKSIACSSLSDCMGCELCGHRRSRRAVSTGCSRRIDGRAPTGCWPRNETSSARPARSELRSSQREESAPVRPWLVSAWLGRVPCSRESQSQLRLGQSLGSATSLMAQDIVLPPWRHLKLRALDIDAERVGRIEDDLLPLM
jgi:Asparagine synthase